MLQGFKNEGRLDLVISKSSLLVFSTMWDWAVIINQNVLKNKHEVNVKEFGRSM